MVFNLMSVGGVDLEWHHGSMNKQSGTATFSFNNLDGKPKVFIIHKETTSTTNGFVSYAILQSDGTYIGKSVTGDTSWGSRNNNSRAAWDDTTNTFSIVLWNSHGTYDYDYII